MSTRFEKVTPCHERGDKTQSKRSWSYLPLPKRDIWIKRNLADSLKFKKYLFPDHNTVNMAVVLCSVFVLLYICTVQSLPRKCDDRGRNYNECDLMFWTGWNTCTGGHGMKPTQCAVGMEKRQKAVCCPRHSLIETQAETTRGCKANCGMTDDDFEVVRPLPTTGTTDTRMSCSGQKQSNCMNNFSEYKMYIDIIIT